MHWYTYSLAAQIYFQNKHLKCVIKRLKYTHWQGLHPNNVAA